MGARMSVTIRRRTVSAGLLGLTLLLVTPAMAGDDPSAGLAAWVAETFPGFRIPGAGDQENAWLTVSSPTPPYLAAGDFNGDGRTDYAALLLAEDDWQLVLAHGEPAASPRPFRVGLVWRGASPIPGRPLATRAEDLLLRAVPKEEEWAPEAGDVPQDYTHPHDALEVTAYRRTEIGDTFAEKALIFWDGQGYRAFGALEGLEFDQPETGAAGATP